LEAVLEAGSFLDLLGVLAGLAGLAGLVHIMGNRLAEPEPSYQQ